MTMYSSSFGYFIAPPMHSGGIFGTGFYTPLPERLPAIASLMRPLPLLGWMLLMAILFATSVVLFAAFRTHGNKVGPADVLLELGKILGEGKFLFCFWLFRVLLRVQGSAIGRFSPSPSVVRHSVFVTGRLTNSPSLHLYTGPIYRVI